MARAEAGHAMETGQMDLRAGPLEIGDVLIGSHGSSSGTPGIRPIRPVHWSRSGTSAAGIRTPAAMWSRFRVGGGSR